MVDVVRTELDSAKMDHFLKSVQHLLPHIFISLEEPSEDRDQIVQVAVGFGFQGSDDPHNRLECELVVRLQ